MGAAHALRDRRRLSNKGKGPGIFPKGPKKRNWAAKRLARLVKSSYKKKLQ